MGKLGSAIFLFLFGLVFFAVGIATIVFFASENTFTCTRVSGNNGTCQYIEKKLIGTKITDFQISNIKEAKVKEDCDDGCTYSVELCTTDKNPLNITGGTSSSGSAEKESYADQINKFLINTHQPNLIVVHDERKFLYIFGGIFALAGMGICMSAVFTFLKGLFL